MIPAGSGNVLSMIAPTMVITLLGNIAKASAATVFLAAFGCIIAASLAYQMSSSPLQPAAEAYRLARLMALLGGIAALLFGVTATAYFWVTHQASDRAFGVIETSLVGVAVMFALAVVALLGSARAKSS